jgi:hypothetical protein
MADYSDDALKTDRPWELWERCKHGGFDVWDNLVTHPGWHEDVLYRRKKVQNLDEEVNPKITAFKLLRQIDPGAAKWIKKHGLKKKLNSGLDIGYLMIWSRTRQGHGYWESLCKKLEKAKREHGLT